MSDYNRFYLPNIQVYYINMDEEVEKAERVEYLLNRFGFKNVTRFPGIKEDLKRLGVAKSHNALLRDLSNEATPFIVLEDDVAIHKFNPTIYAPANADAFYLGNSAYGLYSGVGQKQICIENYDGDIFRIYNMLAAHAILYLNSDYVKFLAQATSFSIYAKTNQDKARAETMKYWNIYANMEPTFYQKGLHGSSTRVGLTNVRSVGPEQAYRK
jgi:hypothetical protein